MTVAEISSTIDSDLKKNSFIKSAINVHTYVIPMHKSFPFELRNLYYNLIYCSDNHKNIM